MPIKRRVLRRLEKKRGTKAWAQRRHAVTRAAERYKMEVGREDLREIVRLIQRGKVIDSEKQSNRVSVHKLIFKERVIRVVYDKIRKQVVSFLPLEREV